MDDPLGRWLPELATRIPNGEKIILRYLAGNTSGIWDDADPMMQPEIDANDQNAIARAYTPEQLIEYAVANGTPEFPPGEGWDYSITNFILLGMVVEAGIAFVAGYVGPQLISPSNLGPLFGNVRHGTRRRLCRNDPRRHLVGADR